MQVREYSLTFHVPTLGMSLLPTERHGDMGVCPCVVGMIQKAEVCKVTVLRLSCSGTALLPHDWDTNIYCGCIAQPQACCSVI
jgi:hypothetical protein